ncbi:hypothetical protein CPC16_006152, partial [Podila verticillata]
RKYKLKLRKSPKVCRLAPARHGKAQVVRPCQNICRVSSIGMNLSRATVRSVAKPWSK